VGSTCEPTLAKRLAKHVDDFKSLKKYVSSFDIIKGGDFYIVLLEACPCNSRDELRMCEQKHIDLCECVNKNKSFRSEEELFEYNKQYQNQYREQHHNEILEQQKQYREQNRDELNAKLRERVCCPNCQKKISKRNIARHITTHSSS
jgi:hypothetical protein